MPPAPSLTAARPKRRQLLDWGLIVGGTIGGGWVADRIGVPAGYLFAAILVGLLFALLTPGRVVMPAVGFRAGQAVTGVALGAFVQSSVLTGLGWRWLPVVVVSAATLALTIAAGIVLTRIADLDRPTASLGMVAGGASGIVAMAGDLGGDDRLVAFMQYLRVLVITLLTPLLVPLAFGVHSGQAPDQGPMLGDLAGWGLTIAAAVAGTILGSLLRLPAPSMLGPLILASVLSITGVIGDTQVPALARETAFAAIGLWIGLSFDRETVAKIKRLAAPVTASIALLLVACFALGWLLSVTANVSLLEGYLATTPGGLYAVLPIAYGAGANTTFVLAVQSLRLLAMILAAPAVVAWLIRSERRRGVPPDVAKREAEMAITPR